jgi:small subunit ribosomal protein S1
MTMEDVMAASSGQLAQKPIHRGMLLSGVVILLKQDGVVVDIGAKIEGIIPYNQLFEFATNAEEAAKYLKPGDELQVYVVRADLPNNVIVLSKRRADAERAWNLLQEIYEKKLPVEVEIVEKVRGGLVANLGVRAFLPASQVDIRRVSDLSPFVGRRLKVRIIELNRKRNRVIISRRSIVEEEVAGQKEETLKKLEPGARLEGEVVEITDFGAFVNLGGVDGLVHRSELSHGRFNHPKEVVKVGDKVKVEVLDMDLERERINLSMKKLIADPWENVLATYHIGQKISGKVTNLTPFGAFVEIEPGLEGLIHVSEMSWTKRIHHPKEILALGQDVEAMILKIDVAQKRISLGLRQTQPDPWSSLPDRFPPGTEVTGPITGITDFGVFMEIEEGIEGLIHISELAHEHVDDIGQNFGRGDEVSAVILSIDPVEQRASLSRKRLLPYTAGAEGESMPLGAPASRGGGRKGRRGGRRGAGIDYDYSYAAADAGGKTTTKLGDVYADLFAQFGLTDVKKAEGEKAEDGSSQQAAGEPAAEASAEATPESASTQAEAQPEAEPTEAKAEEEAVPEALSPTEVKAEAQPEAAQAADAADSSEEAASDDDNAVDVAESIAQLTEAWRQGKKPAQEKAEADEEETATEV